MRKAHMSGVDVSWEVTENILLFSMFNIHINIESGPSLMGVMYIYKRVVKE